MHKLHIYYIFLLLIIIQSCASSSKIKDGNTAYDYKQYENASTLLQKDFDKAKSNENKIDIAKKIISSYQYTQNKAKALEWSKTLYNLNPEQYASTLLQAYKDDEQYQNALDFIQEHTKNYKNTTSSYKNEIEKLGKIIAEAKQATFRTQNLSAINSQVSDYGAFLLNDELYFTSHNQSAKDNFTGDGFAQAYVATKQNDSTFNNIQKFQIENFPYHFAQIVFNKDKTEAFFTQCGSNEKATNDYCKIYTSNFFNASWTKPEKLSFINDSTDEAQPFLSPSGNELYFTANAKDGYGGSDIYISKRNTNGRFSQAYNLGSKINTSANEAFATLTSDTTIYFSSDRKNGIGALDVYQTIKSGNTFSTPVLLDYPINTGADDFYYLPTSNNAFYISSNRNESKGKDDIFFIQKTIAPEPIKPNPPVYQLHVTVVENVYEKENDPNSKIISTKAVKDANVFLPLPIGNGTQTTDANGVLDKLIFYKTKFKYKVSKENYLTSESSVNIENIDAKDGDTININQTILLQKIYKNVEITLDNIYYDYNKANIRADAKANLDTLIYILNENPSIKIELASHTDCRGTATYNEQLSQKRAESVVNYLIEKGISKDRLIAKGYGENALLEKCECTKCTEEQHQKNRRTTFKITE